MLAFCFMKLNGLKEEDYFNEIENARYSPEKNCIDHLESLQLVVIIIIPVFIHKFLVKLAYSVEHGH